MFYTDSTGHLVPTRLNVINNLGDTIEYLRKNNRFMKGKKFGITNIPNSTKEKINATRFHKTTSDIAKQQVNTDVKTGTTDTGKTEPTQPTTTNDTAKKAVNTDVKTGTTGTGKTEPTQATTNTKSSIFNKAKEYAGKGKDWVKSNPKKTAAITVGVAGAGVLSKVLHDRYNKAKQIERAANNKSKSWISRKIAALRSIYAQWLQRANKERNAGRAGIFKKFAAMLLNIIDSLLSKLQGK